MSGLNAIDALNDQALLADFGFGGAHLDTFLRNDAVQCHQDLLGFTHQVLHSAAPGQLLAYLTLAHYAIELAASEAEDFELASAFPMRFIPGIKVGRQAVDHRSRGQGID